MTQTNDKELTLANAKLVSFLKDVQALTEGIDPVGDPEQNQMKVRAIQQQLKNIAFIQSQVGGLLKKAKALTVESRKVNPSQVKKHRASEREDGSFVLDDGTILIRK